MSDSAQPLHSDARTIGLVGLAHGSSHFFHLLLPPLFPLFIRDFGLSYAELGLLVTMFFVISGSGQAVSGFVVDRIGARPVLFMAMTCFAAGALAASVAQSWHGLALAAALAGLGNAPFHPADFTILNKRVSPARLGHAFSVHGISGNLGWAAAPVFLGGLTAATGSWRIAALAAGGWALIVLCILWWQRDALNDRVAAPVAKATNATAARSEASTFGYLKLPAVWLCFSFFFWTTCALSAVQSFASPALLALYGMPLTSTALLVTGFMLCGAVGMVVGGFLVGKTERLEKLIARCLLGSAAALALAGTGWLSGEASMVVAALAGFGTGLAGPSRDMLIKRAAPPNATGRVYGTVYSGLDIGFAVAAPIFGALLDHQHPSMVFHGAALALVAGVVSASFVGAGVARRQLVAA
ncbi:MFS transporter [Ideonella margarita]|uniref:MFS transporter n=1 Tax=Ideonella margarita TaxID=2984191 RepID=A0ABU9CDV1_9BURK